MSQQYYLARQQYSSGQFKNIHPLKINNKYMLLMSSDNSIYLYQIRASGLSFYSSYSFFGYIWKIAVLPSNHTASDYIFIIDVRGRYAVWHLQNGFIYVKNDVAQQSNVELYASIESNDEPVQFVSNFHYFEVLDTKGCIVFNIFQKLIFVEYSIVKNNFRVCKVQELQLNCVKCVGLRWKANKRNEMHLAILQQIEQSRIVRVYNLSKKFKIGKQNLIYQINKDTIVELQSHINSQIILLCEDQLIQINNDRKQTRHKLHHSNGKIVVMDNQLIAYIGKEIVIFNKQNENYLGSLTEQGINLLQGKVIEQCKYIMTLKDGGRAVSIITDANEVIIVILYVDSWKFYYRSSGINSIYSMHPNGGSGNIMVVTNKSQQKYSLCVVQKQRSIILSDQVELALSIQKLHVINFGRFVVISDCMQNSLLNTTNVDDVMGKINIKLPSQELVAVNEYFMVTTCAIYRLDLMSLFFKNIQYQSINIAAMLSKYLIYLDNSGKIKQVNLQVNNEVRVLGQLTGQVLNWILLPNRDLVSVEPQAIKIYRDGRYYKYIELSSAYTINDIKIVLNSKDIQDKFYIVIGTVDGNLIIVNQQYKTIKQMINFGAYAIKLFNLRNDSIGIISGDNVHLYNIQSQKAIQINMVQSCINCIVAYLACSDQIVLVSRLSQNKSIIKCYKLNDLIQSEERAQQLTKVKQLITFDQIPCIYLWNDYLLCALSKKLQIADRSTGRKIKQICYFYKDVIGIEETSKYFLLYGIDSIQRNLLTFVDKTNLQVAGTLNILVKQSKYIKQIRVIGRDVIRLICRSQKYTTLYEVTEGFQIIEIQQIKAQLNGYSLDVNHDYQIFAQSDSYRLLIFYNYIRHIDPMCRYVSQSEVNDFVVMDKCGVLGQKNGCIQIVEFMIENQNQIINTHCICVGKINLCQQITNLHKISNHQVLIGTNNGKINSIKIIDQTVFNKLKQLECLVIDVLEKDKGFSYKQWKKRVVKEDKVIDGDLIKRYMRLFRQKLDEKQQNILKNVMK